MGVSIIAQNCSKSCAIIARLQPADLLLGGFGEDDDGFAVGRAELDRVADERLPRFGLIHFRQVGILGVTDGDNRELALRLRLGLFRSVLRFEVGQRGAVQQEVPG